MSGGTTKYKYNALNELEGMTEPSATKETTFTYDNDHRLTKITYPSGVSENYKLEANTGRPETITFEGLAGGTVPNLSYTYLSGKNQTSLIQTLKESTSGAITTYKYDPLNRLKEATTASTETGHKAHYNYVLYGNGNRKEQTVNLSGETGGTSTFYLYNAANELECRLNAKETKCPENTTTELSFYKYDKAGELTAITPKHDTTGSTFAYNAAAELTAITPSGEAEQALAYAGPGQADLTGVGSTKLQNSLIGLTQETSGSTTNYYARTPNGLLIDERTPSGNFNPLYDAQGDIIALVNTSGKAERTFHYGPYGENTTSEGNQSVPYPFGYKAGYRTPGGNKGETSIANGLYHYGQRYYDPTAGRWTQQDP